jgi:hypothetical protein
MALAFLDQDYFTRKKIGYTFWKKEKQVSPDPQIKKRNPCNITLIR